MFIFYVAKGGERYVSRHYVLKEDNTFIIFTSFLDAVSYVLNATCIYLNWLKILLCDYF